MKVANINVIKAVVQLMENGGRLGDELFVGMATDKEDRTFLIRDYNYPANITVDDKGEITFTSERLKGATKFEPGHDLPVKDAFADYCEKFGLLSPLYFHCNMMEKAIIVASFSNMIRQYDAKGGNVSGEELINGALSATMTNLDQAIKQVDPDMLNDEDSLVQAMIAAGMTPVRSEEAAIATVEEASAETPDVTKPVADNVTKIEVATKTKSKTVSKEEELVRAEKLATLLRNNEDLSDEEKAMLEHLENMIEMTRTRQANLKAVLENRSSVITSMRAFMLEGYGTPIGLHRRYVA